jgi:hypothetical protein
MWAVSGHHSGDIDQESEYHPGDPAGRTNTFAFEIFDNGTSVVAL